MWRAALLAMALSGTPALAEDTPLPPGPDGRWQVTLLDDTAIEPADGVTLDLQGGRITGRSGCNRFFGSYTLTLGFAFGDLGMTRMACPGRPGEIEARFLTVTAKVNDWRLTAEGLELLLDERAILRAIPAP